MTNIKVINYLEVTDYDEKENFDCSNLNLYSLKGSPIKVGGDFSCANNKIKTLKHCPKEINGFVDLHNNTDLEDISDLPPSVQVVCINNCPNIYVFTKLVETELTFNVDFQNENIKKRIRNWKYYSIVNETDNSITVKNYKDNEFYMENL